MRPLRMKLKRSARATRIPPTITGMSASPPPGGEVVSPDMGLCIVTDPWARSRPLIETRVWSAQETVTHGSTKNKRASSISSRLPLAGVARERAVPGAGAGGGAADIADIFEGDSVGT